MVTKRSIRRSNRRTIRRSSDRKRSGKDTRKSSRKRSGKDTRKSSRKRSRKSIRKRSRKRSRNKDGFNSIQEAKNYIYKFAEENGKTVSDLIKDFYDHPDKYPKTKYALLVTAIAVIGGVSVAYYKRQAKATSKSLTQVATPAVTPLLTSSLTPPIRSQSLTPIELPPQVVRPPPEITPKAVTPSLTPVPKVEEVLEEEVEDDEVKKSYNEYYNEYYNYFNYFNYFRTKNEQEFTNKINSIISNDISKLSKLNNKLNISDSINYILDQIKTNYTDEIIDKNLILKILEDRDSAKIKMDDEYVAVSDDSKVIEYYKNKSNIVRIVEENIINIFNDEYKPYLIVKHSLEKFNNIFSNYTTKEHCCGTKPTQFSDRMCNESIAHRIFANIADNTTVIPSSSLDGIVEITHKDLTNTEINYNTELLDDGKDTKISDHVGLNFNISNKNYNFNIISYNLEGLCTGDEGDRIKNLREQLQYKINENTIMVCQELFFQRAKDKTRSNNIKIIKDIFNTKTKTDFIHDDDENGTSCIFYNKNIWELEEKLIINRKLRPGNIEDKCSNAYKFVCISDKTISFVIVNIHLVATGQRDLLGVATNAFTKGKLDSDYVNSLRKYELTNIINKTIRKFYKTPIYLCGDFNTDEDKGELVKEVIFDLERKYNYELIIKHYNEI